MMIFVYIAIIRITQLLNHQDRWRSHSFNFQFLSLLRHNYFHRHLMFPDVQTMINLYLDTHSIARQLFGSFFHVLMECLNFTIHHGIRKGIE